MRHVILTRYPRRLRGVRFVAFALIVVGCVTSIVSAATRPVVVADDPEVSRLARSLRNGAGLRLATLHLDRFGSVDLELDRFRVFADRGRIMHGNKSHPVPRNAYYRGSVEGFPSSLAVLSFRDRGEVGGLVLIDGAYWTIRGRSGVAGLTTRRVEAADDLERRRFSCEADDLAEIPASELSHGSVASMRSDGAAAENAAFSYSARVAVETDWEFLNLFGGDTTAATDYVGDLFAFASSVYEGEVDTSLEVESIQFWPGTAEDDPWTAGDYNGNGIVSCSDRLMEFRDFWRANRTDVDRTIAHMLSGKQTSCGASYVGVLCSMTAGFGFSGSLVGTFDPTSPSPPVWDIIVVSHEIGHNFNSPHTHCYNNLPDTSYPDPVDGCATASGCYSGPKELPDGCPGSDQGCGTIMSYCHLRSGGYDNIAMTFGGSVPQGTSHLYGVFPERVPQRMHAHVLSKASSGCLDPVASRPLLSTSLAGGGTGVVTSDPAGIDCGTDCSQEYAEDTAVTLTAFPAVGSVFAGFGGDADCTDGEVTMIADVSCTATFDRDTRRLDVGLNGGGSGAVTSTPAGIDCGGDCTEEYDYGVMVELVATPGRGSRFSGWSGDPDCVEGPVEMVVATQCTATFELKSKSPKLRRKKIERDRIRHVDQATLGAP